MSVLGHEVRGLVVSFCLLVARVGLYLGHAQPFSLLCVLRFFDHLMDWVILFCIFVRYIAVGRVSVEGVKYDKDICEEACEEHLFKCLQVMGWQKLAPGKESHHLQLIGTLLQIEG